jgi:hypothetical protein
LERALLKTSKLSGLANPTVRGRIAGRISRLGEVRHVLRERPDPALPSASAFVIESAASITSDARSRQIALMRRPV